MVKKFKNILYVIPTLGPAGAELLTIEQINKLKGKYNIYLLILTNAASLVHLVNLDKEKIFIENSNFDSLSLKVKDFLSIFTMINKINAILVSKNIDVVIAQLPVSHFLIRLVKLVYFKSIKIYHVHHSLQYDLTKGQNISQWIFNKVNNLLSFLADNLNIFVSEAAKNNVKEFFYISHKRTKLIYNGIKMPEFDKINPYIKKESKFPYRIVIAGRLVVEKGHIFFLEVFKQIIDDNRFNRFVEIYLVGEGPLQKEIESFVKKQCLNQHVHFVGCLEQKDLFSYFHYSNLTIVPSISEGFGNIAVEAILCNSRVLVSDAGGLKEIVKEGTNGHIYNYQSKSELKDRLISIVNEKGQLKMDNAISYTYDKFSFEKMIKSYDKLLIKKI